MHVESMPDTLESVQCFFLDVLVRYPLPQPYKVHIVLIFYRLPHCVLHGYGKSFFLQKAPGRGEGGKEMQDAVFISELAKSLQFRQCRKKSFYMKLWGLSRK